MLLTDTEALEKANEIIKEIDKSAIVADYFWLQEELDEFIKKHNVTAEQMMDFAISGAGELLYMMTC